MKKVKQFNYPNGKIYKVVQGKMTESAITIDDINKFFEENTATFLNIRTAPGVEVYINGNLVKL